MTVAPVLAAAFALTALLAALDARALAGSPQTASAESAESARPERCALPVASVSLPSLRIEACPACELDAAEIAAWRRAYAEAARAAGYTVDFLAPSPVRITETGALPNGAPYVVGEAAGMRFRVGDPDPGATLGTALGRMTFVILSGAWKSAQEEGLR